MKVLSVILFCLISISQSFTQTFFSKISVTYTPSPNGEFLAVSIPYDNQLGTSRGRTEVYSNDDLLYTIDRAFDLPLSEGYNLVMSNDGSTLVYFSNLMQIDNDQQFNVLVYKNGKRATSYKLEEFLKCDFGQYECKISLVDEPHIGGYGRSRSQLIFVSNDTIYVPDTSGKMTVFEMNSLQHLGQENLDSIRRDFGKLQAPARWDSLYDATWPMKMSAFFSRDSSKTLAQLIETTFNLKYSTNISRFHIDVVSIGGYLSADGMLEIEQVKTDLPIPQDSIKEIVSRIRFESSFVHDRLGKTYLDIRGYFRHPNDSIAEIQKRLKAEQKKFAFISNMDKDTIDDIYIPQDLEDCIRSLDEILTFNQKQNIRNSESLNLIFGHIGGLGIYIRNDWGLNGGSRLLRYFNHRNIHDTEKMTDVIGWHFREWLRTGNKVWVDWEKSNPHLPFED